MNLRHVLLLLCWVVLDGTLYALTPAHNILLIIGFTDGQYQSIPSLKKIYQPYFGHIVFYGPEQYEGVQSFNYHPSLIYECIAHAMKHHPTYEGYLFLKDDCLLSPWYTKDIDVTKIWFPKVNFLTSEWANPLNLVQGIHATTWEVWNSKRGAPAAISSFNDLSTEYRLTLTNNWSENTVVAAYSGITYIPAAYKVAFIDLVYTFFRHQVHLEIALPTIISCLASKTEWVWLPGNNVDKYNQLEDFKPNMVFNHPIRISDHNRYVIELFFNKIMILLGI